MTVAGRIIGWALFLIGVAVGGYEVISGLIAPEYRMIALGELWFKVDAGSLNALQAGIQRYIAPWLWDSVMLPILQLPAWTVFAVPGAVFIVGFHRLARKRRAGRSRNT